MGMAGLIWMMLDIFAGDHSADDKRQEACVTGPPRQNAPARAAVSRLTETGGYRFSACSAHRASSKRCVLDRRSAPRGPGGRSDRRYRHPDGGDQRRSPFPARLSFQARGDGKGALLQSTPIAHVFHDGLSRIPRLRKRVRAQGAEKSVQTIVGETSSFLHTGSCCVRHSLISGTAHDGAGESSAHAIVIHHTELHRRSIHPACQTNPSSFKPFSPRRVS